MKHLSPILLGMLLLLISQNTRAEGYTFVTFHYPPFEIAAEQNEAEGGIVEVVRTIMDNLGHNVKIRAYPWTRALKMVRVGEAAAIFTAYKNPDRERFLDYSREVLFPQSVYFFARKDSPHKFDGDFNKLRSHRIGVVSTISYGQVFEKHKNSLQLDRASNLEQSFQKLLRERVDLVISDIHVAKHTLKNLGLTESIRALPQRVEKVPSFIAFSKKRGLLRLRDEFDRELLRLKQSGEYDRILARHSIKRQD